MTHFSHQKNININRKPSNGTTHTPHPKKKQEQPKIASSLCLEQWQWEEVSEPWLLEWNSAGTLSISTPGIVKTPNASQMQGISTHIWNDSCFLKEICAHICTYVVYSLLHTYTSMNVKTKYNNKMFIYKSIQYMYSTNNAHIFWKSLHPPKKTTM